MNQSTATHAIDRLAHAIAVAIADNRFAADGRAIRRDGWTAERIRFFLETLGACGSVTRAAAAAGISARSAYKLRDRAPGFDRAWSTALQVARPIVPLRSRVLHGSVDIFIRDGRVWERHYFDNRLALAALRRLDRMAAAIDETHPLLGGFDFDALVERACAAAGAQSRDGDSPGHSESRELSVPRPYQRRDARSELARVPGMARKMRPARAIARGKRPFRELSDRRRRTRPGRRAAARRPSIIASDGLTRIHNLNLSKPGDTLGIRRRQTAGEERLVGKGRTLIPDWAGRRPAIHRSRGWIPSRNRDLCASIASAMVGPGRRKPAHSEGS
jgi:hypothetical protein